MRTGLRGSTPTGFAGIGSAAPQDRLGLRATIGRPAAQRPSWKPADDCELIPRIILRVRRSSARGASTSAAAPSIRRPTPSGRHIRYLDILNEGRWSTYL